MKRKKAFFFPPQPVGGYANPYCSYFKQALANEFQLLDAGDRSHRVASLTLLRYSFRADVFFLNWLEIIGYHRWGNLQYVLAMLALAIIRFRRRDIVWMLHNLEPHEGHDHRSRRMYRHLYQCSKLIVAHSKEAAEAARKVAKDKVVYCCHPIMPRQITPAANTQKADILIWGAILPYKGIPELISTPAIRDSELTVHIVGSCKDAALDSRIRSLTNGRIVYENRKASFEEIASLCASSRYVLFPYIGGSISSSGALIDTIVFGGTPVGPCRGAFRDLSEDGVCLTYHDMSELLELLHGHRRLSENDVNRFIDANTWQSFARKLAQQTEK